MQGYLNMPDATDETIVNGWLKTGDFVTIDEDGFIFIVDRKKDLIISKGQNVYPREIEEAIYKLDAVEAAAVIGVKDQYADEEIIAFIQLKEGMKLEEAEVRSPPARPVWQTLKSPNKSSSKTSCRAMPQAKC